MDFFANLGLGIETAFSLANLFYCLVGVFLGTAIGVLPGLGPMATIAILLPITFGLPPVSALIMLAGIYYGAQYGGSTTAILVNLPGEASSVVTALDGYQMARQGKAGRRSPPPRSDRSSPARVATLLIAFFAPDALASSRSRSAPAEYVSLMLFGLLAAIVLASGSVLKAIGDDPARPAARHGRHRRQHRRGTLDLRHADELFDGIDFVVIAMGIFGLGEIIANLEHESTRAAIVIRSVTGLCPTREDFRRTWQPILRGPGSARFSASCRVAARCSRPSRLLAGEEGFAKHPAEFGKGAIEGVAGPEAANNAGAQTSFIPMLTLGIPSNTVMAMMIGALIIQGIQPGPRR